MRMSEFQRGLLVGVISASLLLVCMGAGVAHLRWTKQEVIPVCPVKGVIGGFVPVYGNTVGNRWDKEEVIPMCEVTTGIGGFVPVHGNTIGNAWEKTLVKPFIVVIPDGVNFVAGARL